MVKWKEKELHKTLENLAEVAQEGAVASKALFKNIGDYNKAVTPEMRANHFRNEDLAKFNGLNLNAANERAVKASIDPANDAAYKEGTDKLPALAANIEANSKIVDANARIILEKYNKIYKNLENINLALNTLDNVLRSSDDPASAAGPAIDLNALEKAYKDAEEASTNATKEYTEALGKKAKKAKLKDAEEKQQLMKKAEKALEDAKKAAEHAKDPVSDVSIEDALEGVNTSFKEADLRDKVLSDNCSNLDAKGKKQTTKQKVSTWLEKAQKAIVNFGELYAPLANENDWENEIENVDDVVSYHFAQYNDSVLQMDKMAAALMGAGSLANKDGGLVTPAD